MTPWVAVSGKVMVPYVRLTALQELFSGFGLEMISSVLLKPATGPPEGLLLADDDDWFSVMDKWGARPVGPTFGHLHVATIEWDGVVVEVDVCRLPTNRMEDVRRWSRALAGTIFHRRTLAAACSATSSISGYVVSAPTDPRPTSSEATAPSTITEAPEPSG